MIKFWSLMFLMIIKVVWAGLNENAILYVDLDYSTDAIDSSTSVEIKDQEVWIGVRVADAVYLDTYGFYLNFDTTKLSFEESFAGNIDYDNFLELRGGTGIGFIAKLSREDSSAITIGNSLAGQDSSVTPSGDGLLAILKFNLINEEGIAPFSIERVQLLDWQQGLDTNIQTYGAELQIENPVNVSSSIGKHGLILNDFEKIALALRNSPRSAGHYLLGRMKKYSNRE